MQVIAHRGASAYAPENTKAAFRLAFEMGARAIEFDVHQTKDGRLVIIHDDDLQRTGRRKSIVRKLTLKEIRSIDVGSWFEDRYKDQRVPLLEEVLESIESRTEVHIEIKAGSRRYPGIEGRVVDMIRRKRLERRCLISSFDHKALYEVRALAPELRIGLLMGLTPFRLCLKRIKELKAESLNLSMRRVTPRRIRMAKDLGLRVLVYTVNTEKDFARMKKLGIDGVFSNHPDLS